MMTLTIKLCRTVAATVVLWHTLIKCASPKETPLKSLMDEDL